MKNKKGHYVWAIKVFVLAVVLTIVFTLVSEFFLTGTHLAISIAAIVFFLLLALIFDLIGVAVTVCDEVPFLSMSSRKIKGARGGLWLIRRQEKVASICSDIIGDISAIVSGTLGAGIAFYVSVSGGVDVTIAVVILSAIIAGFTVGGKAITKYYAIKHSFAIIKLCGQIVSLLRLDRKRRKKPNKRRYDKDDKVIISKDNVP